MWRKIYYYVLCCAVLCSALWRIHKQKFIICRLVALVCCLHDVCTRISHRVSEMRICACAWCEVRAAIFWFALFSSSASRSHIPLAFFVCFFGWHSPLDRMYYIVVRRSKHDIFISWNYFLFLDMEPFASCFFYLLSFGAFWMCWHKPNSQRQTEIKSNKKNCQKFKFISIVRLNNLWKPTCRAAGGKPGQRQSQKQRNMQNYYYIFGAPTLWKRARAREQKACIDSTEHIGHTFYVRSHDDESQLPLKRIRIELLFNTSASAHFMDRN